MKKINKMEKGDLFNWSEESGNAHQHPLIATSSNTLVSTVTGAVWDWITEEQLNTWIENKTLIPVVEKECDCKDTKPKLKLGDDYFYYSQKGTTESFIFQNDNTDKSIIRNNLAFYLESDCELYTEVHNILIEACSDPVDYTETCYTIAMDGDIRNQYYYGLGNPYRTQNYGKLRKAIDEIGKDKFKRFVNLRPIKLSECEGNEEKDNKYNYRIEVNYKD